MGTMPFHETLCHCVEKHIPKPLEVHEHHVWPLGKGGPDLASNLLTLCPTTHANVHKLWRLYDSYAKKNQIPPWTELRKYSDYVRQVVLRGREQQRSHNATNTQTTTNNSG